MRPRLFGHIGGTLYTADFKNNNYTTIANVDKTPDEKVRQLQRELNEAGYTDKFGQRLKEGGINIDQAIIPNWTYNDND